MSRHPEPPARPPFDASATFHLTQPPNPSWTPGSGASTSTWSTHRMLGLDPSTRAASDNYKLLISGIVPRPIGFISTVGANGERNLAPMSYTQIVHHDPPMVVVGFSGGTAVKDSTQHILDSRECTVNVISEWFVEAANYCAVNAPREVSEWELSGLTPVESTVVKAPRVAESAFVIEARLVDSHDWISKVTGKKSGTMVILEGVYFHVREDCINADRNIVNPEKLKPVSRLGGVMYGRTTQGYELPRPNLQKEAETWEHVKKVVDEAERRKGE